MLQLLIYLQDDYRDNSIFPVRIWSFFGYFRSFLAIVAQIPGHSEVISDQILTDEFLGCTKYGHLQDVWVFNPKGWTRDQILGDAASKYLGQTDGDVLPTISGYEFSQDTKELTNKKQDFSNFRLYDDATDGPTIQQALDEGWECTGIDGKWCRKPFLNR